MASAPTNIVTPLAGFPCVGDGSYVDGSGTDDSTALQVMVDAAVATGGVSVLEVPPRIYRLNSTITIPRGITIRGLGSLVGTAPNQPPTFVSSTGNPIFDVACAAANIPMVCFENICLTGRTDGMSHPVNLLKFRGTGGFDAAIDTGTILRNVWLQQCSGDALHIEDGATNFLIENGRFDSWGGYAIYATGASVSMTIAGNTTMAMEETAGGVTPDGMMFFDGETSGNSFVYCDGLHLETNISCSESYAGGANPYDRRGLIRFGVNAGISNVQHKFYASAINLDEPFYVDGNPMSDPILSHSVFQVTATSTADSNLDNSRMAHVKVILGEGLERGTTDSASDFEIRILGGRIATNERPPTFGCGNFGDFEFAVGKNSTGETIVSWSSSRGEYKRAPITQPRTVSQLVSDFPREGMHSYVTDSNATLASGHGNVVAGGGSNKVPVYYDGTDWRIG